MFCLILISAYTHLFILCVICIIRSVNEQYVGFVFILGQKQFIVLLNAFVQTWILGLDQNPLATYQELQHLICRTSQLHSTPFALPSKSLPNRIFVNNLLFHGALPNSILGSQHGHFWVVNQLVLLGQLLYLHRFYWMFSCLV